MGLHMPNSPYAAPGIPKGRVAPAHGPETWIGTGDPRSVAQPQAVRRLAKLRVLHAQAQLPCTSTPLSNSHLQTGNELRPPALYGRR